MNISRTALSRLLVAICAISSPAAISAQAQGRGGGMPVVVQPVVAEDLPASSRLVGNVIADKTARVAAEVAGAVREFEVHEGDFVEAGEPLCVLDAELAQLRLDEAKSRGDALRAELEELENGTRKEELTRLKAAVDEADAMVEKWEFERNRIERLYEHSQSNPKEINETEQELAAARGRLAQANAAYETAVNGPRKEQIARARYSLAEQEAVIRQLERDRAKTRIRAPFSGFVTVKHVEVGEWVTAGGAVVEMVYVDRVRVRIDLPERAIRFAGVGAEATLEFEALGERRSAAIARIVPDANPAARTFPIEVDLENTDHAILPGMFVWAHVPAGPKEQRLLVPRDAVVPNSGGQQICVVRSNPQMGVVGMPTPVETGLEREGMVAVRAAGLQAGDLVVTRGNERIFGPTPITPMKPDGAPVKMEQSGPSVGQPGGPPATARPEGAPADQPGGGDES